MKIQFKYWSQLLNVLAALLLISQFSAIVFELAQYSTSRTILQSFDDDAAMAIEVADNTRLYNDNRWSAYGPLYYRVAHVLSSLSPLADEGRNTHFFLLVTSLLAAYGLCWLLTLNWNMSTAQRVLSMCLLVTCFLQNKTWAEFLIRAHPDWLLSLTAAFAFFYLFKLMGHPEQKKYFHLAALGLALGFLTKKVLLFFIPSALLMFLAIVELRPHWKTFLKYSLLYYIGVGFPQAFRLDRDIRFLLYQSKFSVAPDLDSVLSWIQITGTMIMWPLIGLLAIRVLFYQPSEKSSHRILIVAAIAAVLPLLLLFTRKILSPYHYYPMPFIAMLLVSLTAILCYGPSGISTRKNWSTPVFLLVLLAGALTGFFTPKTIGEKYATEKVCRFEAEKIYGLAKSGLERGEKYYVDPYVPFPNDKKYKSLTKGGWTRSWDDAKAFGAQHLALSANFYGRYIGPDNPTLYTKRDDPGWEESQKFYVTLAGKESFEDPFQRKWKKVVDSDCRWQIWSLQESSTK